MSTDSSASRSAGSPDASRSRERSSRDAAERFREPLFVGLTLLGTVVLAIGLAFLILSVTMDTTPPAPYFISLSQKYLVVAGSIVTAASGIVLVRVAARFAGW